MYVTVTDEQDRGDEVTLHYWREGIDDSNADGEAQAEEYQTQTEPLFLYVAAATDYFLKHPSVWKRIQWQGQFVLEGTDWAGNDYQNGGTGGAPVCLLIGLHCKRHRTPKRLFSNRIRFGYLG